MNGGRNNFDVHALRLLPRRRPSRSRPSRPASYDFRLENSRARLGDGLRHPRRARTAACVKEDIPHERPTGMQGFAINLRRAAVPGPARARGARPTPSISSGRTRTLFYGQYTRTRSYFDNSELAADGPARAATSWRSSSRSAARCPARSSPSEYKPPKTDGTGNNRDNLRAGRRSCSKRPAGRSTQDGKLTRQDGQALRVRDPAQRAASFERIALPFVQNLERLGIDGERAHGRPRAVPAPHRRLRLRHDRRRLRRSRSRPATSSATSGARKAADTPGSRELPSASTTRRSTQLIEQVIAAPDRDSLVARTRALDRVLLWGHSWSRTGTSTSDRVAYWDKFGRPAAK